MSTRSGRPLGVLAPTQDLRRALTSFVTSIKSGNPDAQIAILDFAGASVTAVDFTTAAPELDRYIQRLFPNRRADAVLIEALVDGGKKLSDKPSPRRAIVAVDFNAPDSSAVQTMNQAAENIRKSGATVWTVSVRGTAGTSSNREEVLNVVTRTSGGMRLTVVEATGLESMLKSVANSLLSQYTVTFVEARRCVGEVDPDGNAQGGEGVADAVDAIVDSRRSAVVNHSRQSESSVQVACDRSCCCCSQPSPSLPTRPLNRRPFDSGGCGMDQGQSSTPLLSSKRGASYSVGSGPKDVPAGAEVVDLRRYTVCLVSSICTRT